MDPKIKVFLVDDQAMIRAAVKSFLGQRERFEVVGSSGDARKAVDEIQRVRPDVIVLDITMPGLSGLDAIPQIRKVVPKARIVMLTHHEGETVVEQALRAGAEGGRPRASGAARPRSRRGLPGDVRGLRGRTPALRPPRRDRPEPPARLRLDDDRARGPGVGAPAAPRRVRTWRR